MELDLYWMSTPSEMRWWILAIRSSRLLAISPQYNLFWISYATSTLYWCYAFKMTPLFTLRFYSLNIQKKEFKQKSLAYIQIFSPLGTGTVRNIEQKDGQRNDFNRVHFWKMCCKNILVHLLNSAFRRATWMLFCWIFILFKICWLNFIKGRKP
jgi:hypothetical protein